MDSKETAQPPASTSPKPKDPSLPQKIDVEPTFLYKRIAREKGVSIEKAKEWFNNLPVKKDPITTESQKSTKESIFTKKISRRELLGLAAGGTVIIAASQIPNTSWITNLWNRVTQKREEKLAQTHPADSKSIAPAQIEIAPKPDYGKLNRILELTPESKERIKLEMEYVKKASSLEQIDLGFYTVNNCFLREALLEKRYDLRKEEKYGLRNLTEAEKTFAEKYKLHPEFVAHCTDSYFEAKSMLKDKLSKIGREKFFELFRPDLLREVSNGKLPQEIIDNTEIDDLLPNPGVLIGLIWNESRAMFNGKLEDLPKDLKIQIGKWYGAANIGNIPALKAIIGADAENAKEGLRQHIADLNKEAGVKGAIPLKYNVDTVAASDRSGDIGSAQFRPNTAWIFHQFLKENFNFSLHPASLKAVTAACLYLASGYTWMEAASGKMQSKFGFINEKLKKIPAVGMVLTKFKAIQNASLDKWNSDLTSNILEWGNSYQREIIDTGAFAQITQDYQTYRF